MKRRFEFRLSRVRAVRELEERVARSERAHAENLARAAEASRDQARVVLEHSREHLRSLLAGAFDPRKLVTAQRALDGELADLRRKLETARTQRLQAERLASAHRERLSAARALEELEHKARAAHQAELDRHDNQVLDEVAQRIVGEARAGDPAEKESPSRSGARGAEEDLDPPLARAS
jgi:hypothetical protein